MSCHSLARRAAKKTVGLLRGVLADQLQLSQGRWNLRFRHGRQPSEQLFGALQTQARDRHLKVFRWLGHAAVSLPIGFANHTQCQCRAVLHQVGDVAQ